MGTKTRKPLQEGLLCIWMFRWHIKGSGTTRLALLVLKNITSNQLASDVSSVSNGKTKKKRSQVEKIAHNNTKTQM